jgi:putative ABC transport system substrate-binding protein
MRRRQFITLIGGATTWPLTAWAQQSRSFRIGYLAFVPGNDSTIIVQRLQELGYRQGENLEFTYRSADGAGQYQTRPAGRWIRNAARQGSKGLNQHNTDCVRECWRSCWSWIDQ